MNQKKNNMNDNYENVETRKNKLINSNEIVINNIFYFLTLKIIAFVEDCKKFHHYNV